VGQLTHSMPILRGVRMAKKDDLAQIIADNLNKLSDGDKVAFRLGVDYDAPTLFTDFISTGSSILDIAISNRKGGGIACGRITELQGLEGSGKSLIAAHILANTQKRGGVAVLIDTETAVNYDFFDAVGLDMRNGVYVSENRLEEIFEFIENIIETVRKSDKDKLVTIVVDSLSAASPLSELESVHGKDGYATEKAIVISKALRKITKMIGDQKVALIFTNQLRMKMNAMPFADQYTTSGGMALAYHTSTRVRLALTGDLKDPSTKEVIGVKCKAKVTKNRLGPPKRVVEFNILFDSGIDDYNSWFEVMKTHKLFGGSAQIPTWTDPDTGEVHKFKKSTFVSELLADAERRQKIYDQIAEVKIMHYSKNDTLIDYDEAPATEE